MKTLWYWLVSSLHAWCILRCEHPAEHVTADVLEGDAATDGIAVQWCRRCGAYRRGKPLGNPLVPHSAWTVPRPDWWREP